jgi:beta-1,2-mannobiose phosphorylase / 1,2-beta-oligomannan phosphorylase
MNVLPFDGGEKVGKPSIYLAAAESIEDFASPKATHKLLASPVFDWEENRVGASWSPISLGNKEWLIPYHAKKNVQFGYTKSFMIIREQEDDFPVVIHRCSDRLMFAEREWEMPKDYPTPCLFTTGGVVMGEELVMSYGAADQKIGISWVNFAD